MDYERTEKYYTDAKQKYEKRHDQVEWEKWNKRCKNSAGEWNQNPYQKETVYPIKVVNTIFRVMTKKGEYLKSRQMWTGVNAYGDEQTHSIVDPEFYTESKWNHRRIQDPNDRNNIITELIGTPIQTKIHSLLFTPENTEALYAMTEDGVCSFVVLDERRDVPPREVLTIDDFRNKPFDQLINPTIIANTNTNENKPAPRSR